MSEPAVVRTVRGFKRGIDAREAHEMTLMAGRWARLEDRLQQHINNLMKELSEKRAAGIAVGEPMQLERYRALLAQTRLEIARYTAWAEARIDGERGELVELGARHAAEVLEAAGVRGGFNRLATPAIETMTAMVQQGAPLRELLEHVWPKSALGMNQALEDGIALGWGPMKTAREMMRGLESGLQRVLTIARTEQLRAYRMATNAQYRDSGVVTGWMWLCAKNMTVCAACLAMDGTEHPLSEEQQDHPNGGCTSVPILPGEKPEWQTGEKWFETLSEADQRKLLGDKLFEAWDGGKGFEFSRLAQTAHSDTWGDSVRVARLDELEQTTQSISLSDIEGRFTEEVQALAGRDVLGVGDMPYDVAKVWSSAGEVEQEIVLTVPMKEHIIREHPEMASRLGELRQLLLDPDEVHKNKLVPNMAIFYRQEDTGHYYRAAVYMQEAPGGLKHSVFSYRLAKISEVEKGRSRLVYKK